MVKRIVKLRSTRGLDRTVNTHAVPSAVVRPRFEDTLFKRDNAASYDIVHRDEHGIRGGVRTAHSYHDLVNGCDYLEVQATSHYPDGDG